MAIIPFENQFKATISYTGTNYFGWQRQINKISIQERIESIFFKLWKKNQTIFGSSRTDAGVHAYGQVIRFCAPIKYDLNFLKKLINDNMPNDIYFKEIEYTDLSFEPRFNAKRKMYHYFLSRNKQNNIYSPYILHYYYDFDIDIFNEALNIFIGKHDFKSFFTNSLNEDINSIREIYQCEADFINKDFIRVSIQGNGFLRYMIRRIVGAALTVASNKLSINYLKDTFLKKDPSNLFYNLPPNGLMLIKILYNKNKMIKKINPFLI